MHLEGIGGGLRVVEKLEDRAPSAVYSGAPGAALRTLRLLASSLTASK
jgi:hypothetical protein